MARPSRRRAAGRSSRAAETRSSRRRRARARRWPVPGGDRPALSGARRGKDITGATRVVYVSPLKALAVDIAQNLERPLQEIGVVARELGFEPPPISVAVRTGDTPHAQRTQMLRQRPSLVVTTPESLYLLLTSARGRDALTHGRNGHRRRDPRASRATSAARTWRSAWSGSRRCARGGRCGLACSATQRPSRSSARLLVGDRPPPAVVDVGHQRNLDLALELPEGELEAVVSADQFGDVVDRIAALVREHRTTLVFVNTRYLAERVAHQLGERLGDDVVVAHHGSLSRIGASASKIACAPVI